MTTESLFNQILKVLGTSVQHDPEFESLSDKLDDVPEIILQNDFAIEYLFRKSGLQISSDAKGDFVSSVFFHYGSARAESGDIQKYSGDLLARISFGDSRACVKRKLGLTPVRTVSRNQEVQDHYFMEPVEIWFMFGSTDGLKSVHIWHERWLRTYNTDWKQ